MGLRKRFKKVRRRVKKTVKKTRKSIRKTGRKVRQATGGALPTAGAILGGTGGFILGGPAGAALGAGLGRSLGSVATKGGRQNLRHDPGKFFKRSAFSALAGGGLGLGAQGLLGGALAGGGTGGPIGMLANPFLRGAVGLGLSGLGGALGGGGFGGGGGGGFGPSSQVTRSDFDEALGRAESARQQDIDFFREGIGLAEQEQAAREANFGQAQDLFNQGLGQFGEDLSGLQQFGQTGQESLLGGLDPIRQQIQANQQSALDQIAQLRAQAGPGGEAFQRSLAQQQRALSGDLAGRGIDPSFNPVAQFQQAELAGQLRADEEQRALANLNALAQQEAAIRSQGIGQQFGALGQEQLIRGQAFNQRAGLLPFQQQQAFAPSQFQLQAPQSDIASQFLAAAPRFGTGVGDPGAFAEPVEGPGFAGLFGAGVGQGLGNLGGSLLGGLF